MDLNTHTSIEEIAAMMRLTAPMLSPEDTRKTCLALANYVGERRAVWKALITGGAAGQITVAWNGADLVSNGVTATAVNKRTRWDMFLTATSGTFGDVTIEETLVVKWRPT